jgi:hypothetical protein
MIELDRWLRKRGLSTDDIIITVDLDESDQVVGIVLVGTALSSRKSLLAGERKEAATPAVSWCSSIQ